MGWVRDANKAGRYINTYMGFRVYCAIEPQTEEHDHIKDGELWRETRFIPGLFVGIDKTGARLESKWLDTLGWEIDKEIIKRYYE